MPRVRKTASSASSPRWVRCTKATRLSFEAAKAQCSPVVVSIFVNPKQFGPTEDFQKYPRTLESDRALLENLGVDYLFAPPAEEIYPKSFRTLVNVEGLSNRLEGRSRPGHFQGVATVVLKLFEIVQPRFAYFGRKDAQQCRIIQQMAADLNLDTEIVVAPSCANRTVWPSPRATPT